MKGKLRWQAAWRKTDKRGVRGSRGFFLFPGTDWTEGESATDKFGTIAAAQRQAREFTCGLRRREASGQGNHDGMVSSAQEVDRLASSETAHSKIGNKLQVEITVESMRQKVNAKGRERFHSSALSAKTAVAVEFLFPKSHKRRIFRICASVRW